MSILKPIVFDSLFPIPYSLLRVPYSLLTNSRFQLGRGLATDIYTDLKKEWDTGVSRDRDGLRMG